MPVKEKKQLKKKNQENLQSSSWLNRAILSNIATLHRKANKSITLNTLEELWTHFFLARNPRCYSSSQIIICHTSST